MSEQAKHTPGSPDASLIDAAPDMLAALHGAMVIIDTIPWPQGMTEKLEEALVKRREIIIAAIRKAEGHTP